MLLIEQIFESTNLKSDHIKCPSCKRGRLCDKPIGEKVTAIAIRGNAANYRGNRIILKSPKCGQKFILTFTNNSN